MHHRLAGALLRAPQAAPVVLSHAAPLSRRPQELGAQGRRAAKEKPHAHPQSRPVDPFASPVRARSRPTAAGPASDRYRPIPNACAFRTCGRSTSIGPPVVLAVRGLEVVAIDGGPGVTPSAWRSRPRKSLTSSSSKISCPPQPGRPSRLDPARGTHLVLEVVNEGDAVHDLAPADGARMKRLAPVSRNGSTFGVITSSPPELSCTLPGHKSAGLTLDIQAGHRLASTRAQCARA